MAAWEGRAAVRWRVPRGRRRHLERGRGRAVHGQLRGPQRRSGELRVLREPARSGHGGGQRVPRPSRQGVQGGSGGRGPGQHLRRSRLARDRRRELADIPQRVAAGCRARFKARCEGCRYRELPDAVHRGRGALREEPPHGACDVEACVHRHHLTHLRRRARPQPPRVPGHRLRGVRQDASGHGPSGQRAPQGPEDPQAQAGRVRHPGTTARIHRAVHPRLR